MIPWGWIVAIIAWSFALVIATWLYTTRSKPQTVAGNARALARKHARDARREARHEVEAAKAAGLQIVAAVDARAEEEVKRAKSAGLAAHMRDLDADANARGRKK